MFRKDEKKALTRLALLSIGWPAGLDRFYDGKTRDGIFSVIGWLFVFGSIMLLSPCPSQFQNGVDIAKTSSPNPLIILPLIAGLYGIYLIIRKAFRLAKQFENAEN